MSRWIVVHRHIGMGTTKTRTCLLNLDHVDAIEEVANRAVIVWNTGGGPRCEWSVSETFEQLTELVSAVPT